MRIVITNQKEFNESVDFAVGLAKKDKTFECDIFMCYLNTHNALCHIFWEYVQIKPDKQELRVLFKQENIKKFNLNYKH